MYPQLKVNDCRNNHFQLRGYQKFEFLVVTKKKSFFMRRNSKFRLRHVQEKVRTYLCAKYHVSKSCRVFRKITNVLFNLCPCAPVCLIKKVKLPGFASLRLDQFLVSGKIRFLESYLLGALRMRLFKYGGANS